MYVVVVCGLNVMYFGQFSVNEKHIFLRNPVKYKDFNYFLNHKLQLPEGTPIQCFFSVDS